MLYVNSVPAMELVVTTNYIAGTELTYSITTNYIAGTELTYSIMTNYIAGTGLTL
jgi:hypothetical protein